MTKNDKIKVGVAGAVLVVAAVILVWYFFLATPTGDKPESLPEGAPNPNARTPVGKTR